MIDYLLKPIAFDKFLQAANKALRLLPDKTTFEEEPNYIFVKTDKQLVKLNIDDILYIEGMQNYVSIHTSNEKLMALVPMKSVLEMLPSEAFLQIHKSYIIAKSKVEAIVGNQVVINQQHLPISTRMKKEVFAVLTGDRLLKK